MDDFIALVQSKKNRQRVRATFLHAIDAVFCPNKFNYDEFRREPVTLKKL